MIFSEKMPDSYRPSLIFENQSLVGFNSHLQHNIENGYFVFTMMPTLRCSLNCPHCYLTQEERRNSALLGLSELGKIANDVKNYYLEKSEFLEKIVITFYWYGGEPTEMGLDYVVSALQLLEQIFEKKSFFTKHVFLTSLLKMPTIWFDIFKTWGRNYFQTSFDGYMRGNTYFQKWETKLEQAIGIGLNVATISVVNKTILDSGAKSTLDYLTSKGVCEASFLPFMLNESNIGEKFDKFAPTMFQYSQFMIELADYWIELKDRGLNPPKIGQFEYILNNKNRPHYKNVADQTLFLLPNGDFSLPDYHSGYVEYLNRFENGVVNTFSNVLRSSSRRSYIRKQVMRNDNPECIDCCYQASCLMEFWKKNKPDDDCFGAKQLVSYLIELPAVKQEYLYNEGSISS